MFGPKMLHLEQQVWFVILFHMSIIPYNENDVTIPKVIEKDKLKLSFKKLLKMVTFIT